MYAVWTHQDPKHSSNLRYTQMTLVSPRGTRKKQKKDRRDTNVAKRIAASDSTNRKEGEERGGRKQSECIRYMQKIIKEPI